MISKILTSFAAVAASVGLLLWGMAKSYQPVDDDMRTLGLILMLGGVALLLVGIVWYRRDEVAETARVEAEIRRRNS
jgi:hypothetical protein